ncbi:MAG: DUF4233 domain-containing protein [Pseudonocardiaceae bacterium]
MARWRWSARRAPCSAGNRSERPAGWYTAVLALAMVAAACVHRRPWGLALGLALQVAMVAGWFAHPALGGLGVLFVLAWGYLLYARWAVVRRQRC